MFNIILVTYNFVVFRSLFYPTLLFYYTGLRIYSVCHPVEALQFLFLLLLVSNTKIRIFKFRDGFFIRKVRAVNARTRTSNLAQPGLPTKNK